MRVIWQDDYNRVLVDGWDRKYETRDHLDSEWRKAENAEIHDIYRIIANDTLAQLGKAVPFNPDDIEIPQFIREHRARMRTA